MYIDTHCHLNFPQFDADRAMVIGNAKKAGVKKFINPGVDVFSSKQTILLAQKNPGVTYAAIGIHPYEAQRIETVDDLESLLSQTDKQTVINNNTTIQQYNNTVVAIGECGLDYHQYKGEAALGKKDKQKRLFEAHLLLAVKYDLPVIMHCRDAFDDFFTVLDNLPQIPRGVIHCFSGGLQEVRCAKERNLSIGIDGNVTYSKDLTRVVPEIPLSMILLETDAPYLTPAPHRGSRNEPKYIPIIAHTIASLLSISTQRVAQQTYQNAQTLFAIS